MRNFAELRKFSKDIQRNIATFRSTNLVCRQQAILLDSNFNTLFW